MHPQTQNRRGVLEDQLHAAWHVWRVLCREITGRKYEPEVRFIDRFLPAQATVLQIGASDGRHAFYMARKLSCAKIICFEPSPYTYRILNLLKCILRLKQIKTENLAIGAAAGESYLVTPIKRSGHHGLAFAFVSAEPPSPQAPDPTRGFAGYVVQPITMVSIDEYCRREEIHKIDFIRCDVEGSELAVLKGAQETLHRLRPVLLLEVHPEILRGIFKANAADVWTLLEQENYRMYYLQNDDLVRATDFRHEPWRDYFCIPAERAPAFGLS
jgi:FkbM family methyltransferase